MRQETTDNTTTTDDCTQLGEQILWTLIATSMQQQTLFNMSRATTAMNKAVRAQLEVIENQFRLELANAVYTGYGRLAKIFNSLKLADVEIEFKPKECCKAPTQ